MSVTSAVLHDEHEFFLLAEAVDVSHDVVVLQFGKDIELPHHMPTSCSAFSRSTRPTGTCFAMKICPPYTARTLYITPYAPLPMRYSRSYFPPYNPSIK